MHPTLSGAAERRADIVGGPADRLAVLGTGRLEAALEEAPRNGFGAEQVTDVLVGAAELDLVTRGAVVTVGLRVTDDRALVVAGVVEHFPSGERFSVGHVRLDHAVGLPGDQVQRARSRRTERGVVRVVAQRVVLRVIP